MDGQRLVAGIPEDELEEQFVRASGPGGQNVNKVATAVQLRFNVADSPSLPEAVRERLLKLGGRRVTRDGVLIIDARRFRTLERNREDARTRLAALVESARHVPRTRHKTRPTAASRARRLDTKRHRSKVKKLRSAPDGDG